MLAQVTSGAVLGVDAYTVRVEVDLASGLPGMSVVGLPQGAVREGRERVTAALNNTGYEVPPKRVTVNLAPADIRKQGSAFDLPIALGLLAGTGMVPAGRLEKTCFVGELGLDGTLRPVRGVLSLALRCAEEDVATLVVPAANAKEAGVVEELSVLAAPSLEPVVAHLRGEPALERVRVDAEELFGDAGAAHAVDYRDVRGQEHAKRALEVAAAGAHTGTRLQVTDHIFKRPLLGIRCISSKARFWASPGIPSIDGARLKNLTRLTDSLAFASTYRM